MRPNRYSAAKKIEDADNKGTQIVRKTINRIFLVELVY